MNLKAKAFTIIEIMVIMLLIVLLVATFLPKLSNMGKNARLAAVQGIASSFGASVAMAHSAWLVAGGQKPGVIILNGRMIYMSKEGWPEDIYHQADGLMTNDKCLAVWNGVLKNPPLSDTLENCQKNKKCKFSSEVSVDASQCVYKDKAGRGENIIIYDINTGSVTLG